MNIRCYMIEPVLDPAKPLHDGRPSIVGWVRPDTGERHEHAHQFAPGAMWYAIWLEDAFVAGRKSRSGGYALAWKPGPDGRILCVRTPGGDWIIDSRCSNCGMKGDNEHFCWVRHGVPPLITVDKNGNTCNAGGGSIQCGDYHGFLRNGELVPA